MANWLKRIGMVGEIFFSVAGAFAIVIAPSALNEPEFSLAIVMGIVLSASIYLKEQISELPHITVAKYSG
jgi:hypothetical protein